MEACDDGVARFSSAPLLIFTEQINNFNAEKKIILKCTGLVCLFILTSPIWGFQETCSDTGVCNSTQFVKGICMHSQAVISHTPSIAAAE